MSAVMPTSVSKITIKQTMPPSRTDSPYKSPAVTSAHNSYTARTHTSTTSVDRKL